MAEVGTAFLSIVPSARGFGAKLSSEVDPQMAAAGQRGGKRMSAGMRAGLLAGAAVAGAAVGKFLASSIAEAQESAKIGNVTAQLIKNQGDAATISAAQVGKLALAISQKTGVDDEAIQSGQNLLLSFQSVQNQAGKGNAIFDRASQAMVDLGTKMGSPEAAAKVLGKALNDPKKGMTALTRAGVPLTESQKKQVEAFTEAGDSLAAQRVILDAVEQKMGGVAAAQATGAQKMSNAWGNFKEAIGAKLLPVIEAVTTALAPLIEKITSSEPLLTAVAIVLGTVLVVAFAAAVTAMIPLIAATWAFTVALLANPITWIIVGIIALIAVVVLLVKHWDTIKRKTVEVWNTIKAKLSSAWDTIKSKAIAVWTSIKTWISKKWDEIKTTVTTKGAAVLQWFRDLPGMLFGLLLRADQWLIGVGEDIIRGIIEGIGNGFAWVRRKIVDLGGNVLTWAKEILHIGSPSKLMADEVGRWIPAGIALGIDRNAGAVRTSMAGLTSDLAANAHVAMSAGLDVGGTAGSGRGPIRVWVDNVNEFDSRAAGVANAVVADERAFADAMARTGA